MIRILAVVCLASGVARADDYAETSVSAALAMGVVGAGDVRGMVAPGGHFDLGVTVERFRLQGELDTAVWSYLPPEATSAISGRFRRAGVGLRLIVARPGRRTLRVPIFVEGGVGREYLRGPASLDRGDVEVGLGLAPTWRAGRARAGAIFGVRVLVAPAPDRPDHDVGIFFTWGLGFGA
jgi:hypothetical protein